MPAPPSVPDAQFMVIDPVLSFDHVLRTAKVISTVSVDEPGGVDASYHAAVKRIDDLCRRLARPLSGGFVDTPDDQILPLRLLPGYRPR